MRKFDANYHTSIVRNYRSIAKIPDTITDKQIFDAVEKAMIHVTSSNTDQENADEIIALRTELNLTT